MIAVQIPRPRHAFISPSMLGLVVLNPPDPTSKLWNPSSLPWPKFRHSDSRSINADSSARGNLSACHTPPTFEVAKDPAYLRSNGWVIVTALLLTKICKRGGNKGGGACSRLFGLFFQSYKLTQLLAGSRLVNLVTYQLGFVMHCQAEDILYSTNLPLKGSLLPT